MDITENIEIHDCPICGGAGLIEAEAQGYYVACLDCGSYTGTVGFKDESKRLEAAERARQAELAIMPSWYARRVSRSTRGL